MFKIRTNLPYPIPAKSDIPSTHKFLKGTNVAGMGQRDTQVPFVDGSNGFSTTNADINYLVGKGFNCIRLLLSSNMLQNNTGNNNDLPYTQFHQANFAKIKATIDYAVSQNVYTIIARHQGRDVEFGTYNSQMLTARGGDNPGTILADLYRRFAEIYKDQPLVGYDLDNEPLLGNSGPYDWWDTAQKCIDAIRRAGSGQCIYISGISYSGASQWSSAPWNNPSGTISGTPGSNANMFLTLTDPCDNIIATTHNYFSANDTGSDFDVASTTIGRTRMTNVVSWAMANNKRVFIGEFANQAGVTNGNANIIDFVSYIKANSTFLNSGKGIVGAAWWTYAGTGPNSTVTNGWSSYAYTLSKQGAPPPGGTDSAQMTLLGTADFFSDPSAPPVFDPTDISGMLFRYDPANATTSSGATITETIPNTATSAVASTTLTAWNGGGWDVKPTYTASDAGWNNQPTISANTGGTYGCGLRTPSFTAISQPMTWYQVVQRTATASSSAYYRCNNTMQSGNIKASGPTLYTYVGVAATTNEGTNEVTATNGTNVTITCVVYNTTSSAIYINNSTTASGTGNMGSNTFTGLGIGNQQWNKQAIWKVGDMFGFSGAHNATQRGQMIQWLGSKYGVSVTV